MVIAFYKGRRWGWHGLVAWLVRTWLAGPYSHCELVFSDGMSASSSWMDGGVRFKRIEFNPERWDMLDVQGDEEAARTWFLVHEGMPYDVLGLLGFIARPIRGGRRRWFCSEAVMAALGYEESWRFDPCSMRSALRWRLVPFK